MAGLTADDLLTAVKDFSGASSNQEDAADARLLRLLNREQELRLTTLLLKSKGAHRLATLDSTVSSGVLTYPIPTRAIAAGIKQVEAADTSGNIWMLYEFPDDQRSRGWPRNGHFYFKGNDLVFYATPPAGTLRISYQRRLSTLVQLANVGVISSISSGTIGISAAPSGFPTGSTAYDFVRATPHFDILAMSVNATRSSTTMTFTASDVPSTLAVGDHVCLAGQTAYCQAPLELHPVLAQMAVVKWLEAKADPRLSEAQGVLSAMKSDALSLLEPRDENGDDILLNPFAPGWTSRRWAWRRSSGQ